MEILILQPKNGATLEKFGKVCEEGGDTFGTLG